MNYILSIILIFLTFNASFKTRVGLTVLVKDGLVACKIHMVGTNGGFQRVRWAPPVKGLKTTSLEEKSRLLHWIMGTNTDRIGFIDVLDFGKEWIERNH